jgi:hypothetical protein
MAAVRLKNKIAFSVLCATLAWTGSALADGIDLPRKAAVAACSPITLACENSRSYGICPIAVTDAGELVTASMSPGLIHMRLVPMGVGYRYIGKGIWFDGKDRFGRLFFGSHRSVACEVTY